MYCESCQKHTATVHQIEVRYHGPAHQAESREVRQLHLCAPCAKAAGMPVPAAVPSYPKVVSLLSKALLHSQSAVAPQQDRSCPHCGWTLRDFRQTSRFGCPEDYEVFKEFVDDLLERLHGTSEHPTSGEAELARLSREMNEAAAREDYESAARLRDRISEIEARLQHMEGSE